MKLESIKRLNLIQQNANTPIHIGAGRVKKPAPLHAHRYYELELFMDGKATHFINGGSYEIERGYACILSPMDFHTYTIHSSVFTYCLNFDSSIISPKLITKIFSLDKSKPIKISDERLRDAAVGDILIKECHKENGGCSVELCECFLSLILSDNEAVSEKLITTQEAGIQRAITYLSTHFFENPTLEEIATVAGYNTSYFSNIFKKQVGESFISRLNRLKVEFSKVLLSHGSRVIDACFDSGFQSLSSFQMIFKKYTEMSPNAYKQLHNSKKIAQKQNI